MVAEVVGLEAGAWGPLGVRLPRVQPDLVIGEQGVEALLVVAVGQVAKVQQELAGDPLVEPWFVEPWFEGTLPDC